MIRVLLVDDEEDALNLLEILLGQIGDVTVVGRYLDPVRAIEALDKTPVDAVFLDNQMPGMTGIDAARKIRDILPQIPIVFTTAYSEYAVEAFEIQSTDYLLKPITMNRLQNAVSRIKSLSENLCTAETNPGASKVEHRFVVLHFLLPTNEQAAKTVDPGVGSFDHPSPCPVSRNRCLLFFLFTARTQMKDVSQLGYLFPDDRIVVSLIQAQMLRVLFVRFRS